MAFLTKLSFAGRESDVKNFIPGDNISFVTQSDGSIRINASGGGGGGGTLYPDFGQNTDGAMTQKASTDAYNNYNNVVLKTLTVEGWTLNGTVYEQTLTFTDIYDKQPSIVPCGAALGSLASDAQYAAASGLKVMGDDVEKTMTFYASVQPTVDINLAIQGVA